MKLTIQHVTHYDYSAPLQYALQSLCLPPQASAHQPVHEWTGTAPAPLHAQPSFGAMSINESVVLERLSSRTSADGVLSVFTDGSWSMAGALQGDHDLLLSGGVGTTASLTSNTVVWLYQHPEVRQRLIDDPSLMDKAIEEFQALARSACVEAATHARTALHHRSRIRNRRRGARRGPGPRVSSLGRFERLLRPSHELKRGSVAQGGRRLVPPAAQQDHESDGRKRKKSGRMVRVAESDEICDENQAAIGLRSVGVVRP